MIGGVNEWRQSGKIYLWRYPPGRAKHAGWHFSADAEGCACMIDLLDRMHIGAAENYRTVTVEGPTDQIWGVPNFGDPIREEIGTLRICYEPGHRDFDLGLEDGRVVLRIGTHRLADLRCGVIEVSIGGGDFAMSPASKNYDSSFWFWWMPRRGKHRF